ncbi:hypothetical protein [Micromonospora sp. CPCC 206061]|uniref:hypothetical protein n=1 Tax=Micromonospora sp. CPCC 206061 TaxID=3122410 RepID=UPI002FF1E09B
MTPIDTITAALRTVGAPDMAAINLARRAAARYTLDASEEHNGLAAQYRIVRDRPSDALAGAVRHEDKSAAGVITLALTRLVRAGAGPSCPDAGLAALYAAEAVVLARDQRLATI